MSECFCENSQADKRVERLQNHLKWTMKAGHQFMLQKEDKKIEISEVFLTIKIMKIVLTLSEVIKMFEVKKMQNFCIINVHI